MKRSQFITLVLVIGAQLTFFAQQQKTTGGGGTPSDALTGYTYDFNKAKVLIISRITQPTQANADVQPIVSEKSFPQLKEDDKVDAVYDEKVREWMEKNPNLIINTLKDRKDIVQPY